MKLLIVIFSVFLLPIPMCQLTILCNSFNDNYDIPTAVFKQTATWNSYGVTSLTMVPEMWPYVQVVPTWNLHYVTMLCTATGLSTCLQP